MPFKSNKSTKSDKLYTISLVTPNGNTVGYINLSNAFIKVTQDKSPETMTVADVMNINGDFIKYLASLEVVVEETKPTTKIEVEDY